MGMQYIPAFQLCMSFQDLDVARKIIWKRTKTIFITVITCTACLWLFQFPIAVSLMKSSLPNALHFEFLLFLAVLLILLWSYWKGSTSTNCSKRQCDIQEHPVGNRKWWKVVQKSWVLLPVWWHLSLDLVNTKPSTLKLLFLFLYSSALFLITEKLMFHSFPSNYLWFISQSYFTKTWKHAELAYFIAGVIPSREFESTGFVFEKQSEQELSGLLLKILKRRDSL